MWRCIAHAQLPPIKPLSHSHGREENSTVSELWISDKLSAKKIERTGEKRTVFAGILWVCSARCVRFHRQMRPNRRTVPCATHAMKIRTFWYGIWAFAIARLCLSFRCSLSRPVLFRSHVSYEVAVLSQCSCDSQLSGPSLISDSYYSSDLFPCSVEWAWATGRVTGVGPRFDLIPLAKRSSLMNQ